jgi:alkylhydroperoxidase family enzyme
VDSSGATARSVAEMMLQGQKDSVPPSTSAWKSTTLFFKSRRAAVGYADDLLRRGKDTLSITITQVASSGVFSVSCVTNGYSVLGPQTFWSRLRTTFKTRQLGE